MHFSRLINLSKNPLDNSNSMMINKQQWMHAAVSKRWLWFMESVIYGHSSPKTSRMLLLANNFALICIQLMKSRINWHQLTNPAYPKQTHEINFYWRCMRTSEHEWKCEEDAQDVPFTYIHCTSTLWLLTGGDSCLIRQL